MIFTPSGLFTVSLVATLFREILVLLLRKSGVSVSKMLINIFDYKKYFIIFVVWQK